MRDRHDCIRQAWAAVEPAKGHEAIDEARHAIRDLKMLGLHFHPIMQHFSVDDRRHYPLFEEIVSLDAPVMIDVGMTGMGAGMPGGMGAKTRHAHPAAIDALAADFPTLKIVMAHPGYRIDETTAVACTGQCLLGSIGLGAEIFAAIAGARHARTAARQNDVRQRHPSIPMRACSRREELGFSDQFLKNLLPQRRTHSGLQVWTQRNEGQRHQAQKTAQRSQTKWASF
jgi:predicted TIM-barrel fold metal-dependent hydrolase